MLAMERAEALDVVDDAERAVALLQPLRLQILEALTQPDSAAGLARRLRVSRQKVNYHVRALARAGFLRRAGRRRKGNMTEQHYRTSAQGYVLSPELLGRLGADVDRFQDAFSAGHLLALTCRAQAEVALAARLAREQGKRLATLSVTADFRFESAEQRAAFAEALQKALLDVVARHTSPASRPDGSPAPGRPYRLIVGAYPIPPRTSEKP
jgi:DNA-binding transcriptional ArsR family regulator